MTDLDKDARIAELEAALRKILTAQDEGDEMMVVETAEAALAGDGSAGAKVIQAASSAEFVRNLPLVMDRAMRLGLYKTGHALHEAVRVSGYELAAALDKED